MVTVYKYRIELLERQVIDMPAGSKFLHGGLCGDDIYIWVEVDIDTHVVGREFVIVGTGQSLPDGPVSHLFSVVVPPRGDGRSKKHGKHGDRNWEISTSLYVWHIYSVNNMLVK